MTADIKAELDAMEEQGIITRVREGEPTRWVNSLVYRRKPNGQIRICLDPKDLNKANPERSPHNTNPRRDPPHIQGCKVLLNRRRQVGLLERRARRTF